MLMFGGSNNTSDVPKKVQVGNRMLKGKGFIAEGGFSHVYLVKDINTKEYFALKRMICSDQVQLAHAIEEVAIQKKIPPHEHIVKLIDIDIQHDKKGSSTIYILMENMSGGRLIDVMKARTKKFSLTELLDIFMTISCATKHLHDQNPPIAHRDLKIENVLKDEDSTYKVCDFGSCSTNHRCCETPEDVAAVTADIERNTTPAYRAPEMIDLHSKKIAGPAVDIWALGCLVYKMAFYKDAFDCKTSHQILSGQVKIPGDSPYRNTGFHDLIGFLLVVDPDQRPNIDEVIDYVAELRATPWQRDGPTPGEMHRRHVRHASTTDIGSFVDSPPQLNPMFPTRRKHSRTVSAVCSSTGAVGPFEMSPLPAERPPSLSRNSEASTPPVPEQSEIGSGASETGSGASSRRTRSDDVSTKHTPALGLSRKAFSDDSLRGIAKDAQMHCIVEEIDTIRGHEAKLAQRRKKLEVRLLAMYNEAPAESEDLKQSNVVATIPVMHGSTEQEPSQGARKDRTRSQSLSSAEVDSSVGATPEQNWPTVWLAPEDWGSAPEDVSQSGSLSGSCGVEGWQTPRQSDNAKKVGKWLNQSDPKASDWPESQILKGNVDGNIKSQLPPMPPLGVSTKAPDVAAGPQALHNNPSQNSPISALGHTPSGSITLSTVSAGSSKPALPEKLNRHRRSHSEGLGNAFSFSIRPQQQLASATRTPPTINADMKSLGLDPPPPPPSRSRK